MTDSRSPEQIRSDIEATREELADTAAALAHKADVKARVHDRVDEIKSDIRTTIKDKTPDTSEGPAATVSSAATSAGTAVKRNPVPTAAVAAALLGFALGYLWATRGADD